MRPLHAADVVDLWEQSARLAPGELALALLGHACPELPPEQRADLPLGRRDDLILELRARTLGGELTARADCPACGEPVELSLRAADLRAGQAAPEAVVERGPLRLRVRPPSTRDLERASAEPDPRAALLARCVTAERDGSACPIDQVDAEALAAAVAAMAACDPMADVQLALTCPACAHAWSLGFDIVTFFARELAARGARLLHEVHALARAYGWSEREILGLPAARRQRYLELVGA